VATDSVGALAQCLNGRADKVLSSLLFSAMRLSLFKSAAFLLTLLAFSACGPTVYLARDFRAYAPKHKQVAILPAAVTMQLRPNEYKAMGNEQLRELESRSGLDFQEKIYSWLLRRSQQRGYTIDIQDVARTNALLSQHNITYTDLRTKTPEELAQVLGVDAVLSSSVRTTKPMSEGAALALGAASTLLNGAGYLGWTTTNQANITVNIHEREAGKLLWKYDYDASHSVGSSTESTVDALMRNASKKFPYTAKANRG
jgi:hypothetical protein